MYTKYKRSKYNNIEIIVVNDGSDKKNILHMIGLILKLFI